MSSTRLNSASLGSASLCQVKVLSGRKAGAISALPLGELSIGTTLEADVFIGCLDMWHQLLRADSSANSRSATASGDALPEQLMLSVLNHTPSGISLTVEKGFAEIGRKRLLPGDSGAVGMDTPVRIGSSEIEIQVVKHPREADVEADVVAQSASTKPKLHWLNNKAAFTGITALAVAGLCTALLIDRPVSEIKPVVAPALAPQAVEAVVFDERVVAVVSTAPAFFMTESGQRFDVGEVVDDGYKIVSINGSDIELQRGAERLLMSF